MLRDFKKLGTVTMADNGVLTDAIHIPASQAIAGIMVPTGWVAADIGFHFAHDGDTTFVPVLDPARAAATNMARTHAAVDSIGLSPECIREIGCGFDVKFSSVNTASNADVSQTGGPLTITVFVGKAF